MSADSPRRTLGNASRGMVAVPSIVPPQVVSDRSILDSAIGFINEVTLAHQPHTDPKDTITWARFETAADISDPRYGDDWELEGNVAPPLLLILGYGLGVQVWAIPANGEAVEVLSWRHGIVSALRVLPTPSASVAIEENGRADEPIDVYAEKRPLIALVDGSPSSGSQPQFCAVNFISLKTGTQVKTIKFKNPVIDVLANRSSIVITFHERIAVFDARTLEDRLSITTCYPSPGINPNPVALGHRWLAYAEHKLIHSKRSGGGCDGEGVASYTATVLNASKSLVKGLRELGEQVAAGLTGTSASGTSSKNTSFDSGTGPESKQSGVVTIIDIKNPLRDYSPTSGVPMSSSGSSAGTDPMVAHFIAHSEALVAMEFDNTGMLLLTADRRGHDFHVFRIQPNPVGASLAAVHHLYVLHRGDTSAKVQNISFSLDSRWVAVSTLRGTTHVFPITPYGGPMGVRTHTSLHVVNKLSRFHRSAGLSAEGRSNSPISHSESTTFSLSLQPYHNPTLPPYPRPTVVMPLAQLRQPFALGSPPGSATLAGGKSVAAGQGPGSQRQRLSSLSDDSGKPLSVCAIFAKSRSWLLDPPNVTREAPHRMQRKAVDSLFVMAGHGALIQYDLDTKLASSNVAKEKICDDTPIELEVEAKAQWNLGRRKEGSQEIMPPLTLDNWLVKSRNSCMLTDSTRQYDDSDDRGESWLAQVEIVTHAGPHRRLWMGPQFVFKTYNTPSGSNLSHVDIEAVEIGTNSKATTASAAAKPEHSSPLNMPLTAAGRSSAVPVLIESGSYSSIEQSPKLMDRFRHDHLDSDFAVAHGDTRLKEDLADAMRESPSVSAASKDLGGRGCETTTITGCSNDNIAFYDALADHDEDQDQDAQDHESVHNRNASAAALASALPNIYSYDNSSSYESMESLKKPPQASIEKIVNPLGTVTTVTSCLTADINSDILDEVVSQLAAEDTVIHENCDESLFRPVVAIFCDEKTRLQQEEDERKSQELCQPPENIGNKLVVPVIEKEVDDELNKKEKQKNISKLQRSAQSQEQRKFEELSSLNRKSKNDVPTKGESSIKEPEYAKEASQISRLKEIMPEDRVQVEESTATKSLDAQESKEIKETLKAKEIKRDQSKMKEIKIEEVAKTLPKLEVKLKENESSSLNKESVEPATEADCVKKISKSEGMAKEKVKTYCDDAKTKQSKTESKAKESIKASTGPAKAKKVSKSKESTPEREQSPKPVPKQMVKALTCDESEEELPMEFEKMTPVKEDNKAMPQQQILTKKEIKKQQQKVQEETNKQNEEEIVKEVEKEQVKVKAGVKISKEQKNLEESIKSKVTLADNKIESDIKKEASLQDNKTKEIIVKGEKNKVPEEIQTDKKVDKKEALPISESRNKSTACEIEESTLDKGKPQVKESSTQESPKTAVDIQISAINKTAIKEEIKRTPTVAKPTKTDITKPAKTETSQTIVKTEQLNVKDLADSLIELQDEEDQYDKPKEKPTTPVLETVEIYTAPTIKLSKKNKKKANKSGSSSETDEVVEIVKTDVKSKAVPALKKKSSFSSEEIYVDLADSLLERKDADLKDTMFISFSQIEERNKLQEKNKAKPAESAKELSEKTATASKAATSDKKDSGKKRPENTSESLPKLKSESTATTIAAVKDNEKRESLKGQEMKKDLKLEKESEEGKTKQREDKCLLKEVKQSKAGVSVEEDQLDHSDASAKASQFRGDTLMDTTKSAKNEELKGNTAKKVEDSEEPAISKLEKKNVVKFSLKSKEECKEMEKNTEGNAKSKPGERVERPKEEDPKKPSENLKKNEEKSEKNVKQTSENIKKNKEPIATNKLSGSEDSNKDKSQSTEKITNPDENDKKKADASKKLDEKKIDCEYREEKQKDSIKNVKETPEDLKTKIEETTKKKSLQDSKIPLIDKEMKISEKDKAKVTAVSKSKDSKMDEGKNLEIKSAMASEKSPQPVKASDAKDKNDDKDIKKLETKKTLEKPKSVLSAESDVIVEQPRRQQNKELEKEIIKHHEKEAKAIEKKGNVADEDVSLKPLPLPPMPSRRSDNKASNVDSIAAKKSNEIIAPKEIPKESSKTTSKKKPEENVHSSPMPIKPLAASKAEAKNLPNEKPRKSDEVHNTKIPESLTSDVTTKKPPTSMGKTLTSPLPSPPPPIPSAWKTLSGAEMIAQNLRKDTKPDDAVFPSLGAIAKSPKSGPRKLLPELPTPKDVKGPPNSKKSKATSSLDDFPTLHALEPLPPLPSLEPLELLEDSRKDVSLINFESPLSENPAVERKITPPPRGFTEQNLIFALCGSLHYENEQRTHAPVDKSEASSSNRSSLAMDEPSMADYKSLTENDDPYISLEQSSQDTNTTNTHTTNDKFSSSNNSSGTEEIIIMEEKKMTKKQKRKRQQQLLELQKQKELQNKDNAEELDDEELRPLIAMSESQVDNIAIDRMMGSVILPSLLDESFSTKKPPAMAKSNALTHSTTTDSEGPMPATTSDDNVFIMPSNTGHTQHKIKTKKMEHKFNLIAAIEAATSSSTSSAEESGVEVADDSPPMTSAALMSAGLSPTGGATPVLPIPMSPVVVGAPQVAASLGCTVGALKKKTKRPIQFYKDQQADCTNDTTDGMNKMRNQLNHKKSTTTDLNNSNYDSNTKTTTITSTTTTTTSSVLKQKSLNMKSLSQDTNLPPQTTKETHNSIYEMKQQQQQQQQQQQLQYLTCNAMDNCFASPENTNHHMESATIVNIDIFDDQLSTSSLSNTSRFSCEAAPLTTTTPPISLNGVIDANLMHFSQNTKTATAKAKGSVVVELEGDGCGDEADMPSALNDNKRMAMRLRRQASGGSGASAEEYDEDDDDNSSNGSAGSL